MKLVDNGLSAAQISLDGNMENHDFIRGKGSYNKAIEGIKNLINNGVSVRIGMTINRHNIDDIIPVTQKAIQLGADSIVFFRYMPSSIRGQDLDLSSPSLLKASREIINAHSLKKGSFMIYFDKLSFFSFLLGIGDASKIRCQAGRGMCNINTKGEITFCSHLPKPVGNIDKENIATIWKRLQNQLDKLDYIPEECGQCQFAETCRGGCKGISYILYGDLKHKDKCCFKDLL